MNSAPLSAWLLVQHNFLLVNTSKTVSTQPPPPPPPPDTTPPDSSCDSKKQEKQSRTRQKIVKVKSQISEHDLNIKISHMCEWLEKGLQVSVFISKNEKKPEVSFAEIVLVTLLL